MLRLKTFGGLSIVRDTAPAEGAGAQRRRLALLALLDGAGDRGLSRDKLLGYLWPESDPEKARGILNQALYALRRDLGNEELFLGSIEVRLNPAVMTSDRAAFETAIDSGHLESAVAVYEGPFLDGFYIPDAPEFERWVEVQRNIHRQQYLAVLEQLAAAAAGDARATTMWWRRLAVADPHNARVALGLMRALAAGGDRSAALQHYRSYETLLRTDLELDPDPDVRAFAEGLRRPEPPLPRAPISEHTDEYARPRPAPERRSPPDVQPREGESPLPRAGMAPQASLLRQYRWLGLALALAVVAFATRGLWLLRQNKGTPIVAVGRIADYTRSDQDLGRPLADMLATDLARASGLQVVSTARMYDLISKTVKGTDTAAAVFSAAREAGATELLEGTLYDLGGGLLRLDLRRTDLDRGSVLRAYSVEGKDLFSVAERGTEELARNFGAAGPGTPLADVTTTSLVAYRLYEEGLRAFYTGKPGGRELLESALREDSTFAMAAYSLALTFGGDRSKLVPAMQRALRLSRHATDRERLLIEAGWADATDDPGRLAIAETLTVRYPSEPEGFLFLGHARIWDGDFLGALAPLRRVVEMDSLGLKQDPRSSTAPARCQACSAVNEMISAYTFADSFPAAERIARRWARQQPGAFVPWVRLAQIYAQTGRYEEALAATQAVAGFAPHINQTAVRMSMRARAGDFATADTWFRQQIAGGDSMNLPVMLEWLTNSLRTQGRLGEAIEVARVLRNVLDPSTDEPRVLPKGSAQYNALWEAQILFEMGQPRVAAALFDSISRSGTGETASRKARHRAWTQTLRATALAAAGDTAGLEQVADSVEAWGSQTGYGRDRRLHHHVRGLLLYARSDLAGAEREFRQAVFSPVIGYTRTNVALADVLLALNRPAEAAAWVESAVRGPIEGPNTYVTQTELFELAGRAYELAGRRDSAIACYKRVVHAWQQADSTFRGRKEEVEQRLRALESSRGRD